MGFQRCGLTALLMLNGCAITPSRAPLRQVTVDSVSSTCGRFPETCAAAMGKAEIAAAGAASAAGVYQAASAAGRLLGKVLQEKIDDALSECADLARSEVLIRHGFKATSPTEEQCLEEVTDAKGQKVTRAMLLGQEMHAIAEKCAERSLNELRPGGFSIEQRYRYDPGRGLTPLPRQTRGIDLQGTLVPDIVIHDGSPIHILEVYDFKFPCLNLDDFVKWREYPDGPFRGQNRKIVYTRAFGKEPRRVQPRLGVDR